MEAPFRVHEHESKAQDRMNRKAQAVLIFAQPDKLGSSLRRDTKINFASNQNEQRVKQFEMKVWHIEC